MLTEQLDIFDDRDRRVRAVLFGMTSEALERQVLSVLMNHRGALNAFRAASIAATLELGEGENARRKVTGAIESLRMLHGILIGGSRVPPYGYFLIETRTDLAIALQPLRGELHSLLRLMRLLAGRQETAAMYGQLMLQLDKKQEAAS